MKKNNRFTDTHFNFIIILYFISIIMDRLKINFYKI